MNPISPDLYRRRDGLAAATLTIDVLLVAVCGVAAYWVDHPLAYIAAFILVGARGQSLYVLQHETMHGLLFSRRAVNDAVGVVLSAFLGTRFCQGRAIHMLHHRRVGQTGDPNETYHGTVGKEPKLRFLRFLAVNLLGGRLVMLGLGLAKAILAQLGLSTVAGRVPYDIATDELRISTAQSRSDLAALVVVQAVMFASISLASSWYIYFLLYVLPLSTLTALFEALRSFSEHVLPGGEPINEAEANRRFFMRAGPVELFFISQHGFHYHHVHHLYPNVPTFNVKAVHAQLIDDPAFRARFITRPGYIGTALLYLRGRPIPGGGAVETKAR